MIIKLLISLHVLLLVSLYAQPTCKYRIISQSPFITADLEFFSQKKCIVGASVYDERVGKDIRKTGKVIVPDKMKIEALKPDLIFLSDWTNRGVKADITPLGAKSFTLHGFESMQEIENSLYTIGNVLQIPDFTKKIAAFSKEWRSLAHSIDAQNKKVLLISACTKTPYSYGRKTYLGELFSEAGFDVVDRSKKVKAFTSNEALQSYIKEHEVTRIFGFVPYTKASTCSVLSQIIKEPIIYLDGDNFLNPSPTLLEGLKELKSKESEF